MSDVARQDGKREASTPNIRATIPARKSSCGSVYPPIGSLPIMISSMSRAIHRSLFVIDLKPSATWM